ncbi:hypothetical protein ANCDUO_04158 [Ancylostoma duodenale]|uniref:MULE transposase domain-containing protein n=1 Tax=Ancylostoma duodenale TaxID=51022 RepID=A0A0C2H7U8_9BILA|nr:hypothetical protein ANCDUO_04158 [Ancylostoma duodenale]
MAGHAQRFSCNERPKVAALEEGQALMDEFHDYGYERRRRQIAKTVEKHDKPRATLDDVPERLRTLMDGSCFFKYSSPGLYIWYSNETIKAAVDNGLVALVADGIHKLPPEELGEHGLLYTISLSLQRWHMPIFHVPTREKNVNVYAKVSGIVEQELQTLEVDVTTLGIILDFEKAALAGIKKHFPMECVEGCGFHLAHAWNRRALSLCIKGDMKDVRVRKWWLTIKGLRGTSLPSSKYAEGPSVLPQVPEVPRLHKTWYGGPFKKIWYTWDKKELRTSNVAETCHRLLRLLVREKYAPVRKIIECIRGSDNRAMCALGNLQKVTFKRIREIPSPPQKSFKGIYRKLRKRDIEWTEKIDLC